MSQPRKETPNPTIPFGKHKGKQASDVPVDYLDWLLGLGDLREPFAERLLAHLKTREDWAKFDPDDKDEDLVSEPDPNQKKSDFDNDIPF